MDRNMYVFMNPPPPKKMFILLILILKGTHEKKPTMIYNLNILFN